MDSTTPQKSAFTCRLSSLCAPDGTSLGKFAHVTITFLGVADDEMLLQIQQNIVDQSWSGPVSFTVVGYDNFGPKADIPVVLVHPDNGSVKQMLIHLHAAYGKPDYGFYPEVPNFHVSARTLSDNISLQIGDIFLATKIDIKQLGPHDPCFSISLQ